MIIWIFTKNIHNNLYEFSFEQNYALTFYAIFIFSNPYGSRESDFFAINFKSGCFDRITNFEVSWTQKLGFLAVGLSVRVSTTQKYIATGSLNLVF